MPFKERIEKDEIKILRFLNARKKLKEQDKKNLIYLTKGFEGEVKFDQLTNGLPEERFLVVNDLQLEDNNTTFQIDSNILVQGTFNTFEVKNFEGDYDYDPIDDKFYCLNYGKRKEVLNPLDQKKRCETLFRQFLQSLGIKIQVKSWLIFINPEFYLHHAPENPSIIYPAQINRFMKKFSETRAVLNDWHFEITRKLVSFHQVDSPYEHLPEYGFDELEKGLLCGRCYSFMVKSDRLQGKLVCKKCGNVEKIETGLRRNARELQLLFPEKRATTNLVFEWCGGVVSKRTIQRFLPKKMILKEMGKSIFYE